MKRLIPLIIILLALSVPALADIAMPPDSQTFVGNFGACSVGMKFQGLPNGDIVILVYRKVWAYQNDGATTVKLERVPDFDPQAGVNPPSHMRVWARYSGEPDTEVTNWLGRATQLSDSADLSAYTGLMCIDAYLWPSHLHNNGSPEIGVDMCADLTCSGQTEHIRLNWYYTVFYPTDTIINLTRSDLSASPNTLTWNGGTGSLTIPMKLTDGAWPLGSTKANVEIYSIETGQQVASSDLEVSSDAPKPSVGSWECRVILPDFDAPKGLYAYKVSAHHIEDGWAWDAATGSWPFWQVNEYSTGIRNVLNGSTSGPDQDSRTTDLIITPGVIKKISDPSPAPASPKTALLFNYNLSSRAKNQSTGVKIYGPDLSEVGSGIASLMNSQTYAYQARVDANLTALGDYYYVIWAIDNNRNNKGYIYKPALERGGKLNLAEASFSCCAYTYDEANGRYTVSNNNGTSTLYTFDARYRLRQVKHLKTDKTSISGAVVNYTLDGSGNRKEIWFDEDRANKLTSYNYDEMDRLQSVAPSSGGSVAYAYDWLNNRIKVTSTDSGGNAVELNSNYNKADQFWQDGLVLQGDLSYHSTGSLHRLRGADNKLRTYSYDLRELLSIVEISGL